MEQRIAAYQGDVTSARAMDVTGFAGGHKGLGSNDAQCLTGVGEFSLDQLAEIGTRRLQREHTVGGTDVGAEMYPGGAPVGNRAFPSRSTRHKVVETEMAEFMTAVGGEDHIAGGRGRDERAQCFEPAD